MLTTSRPKYPVFVVSLIFCCSTSSLGQAREHKPDACLDSKRGLHATLNAKPGYYGDPRLETLTFRLMNDSDQVLDSATSSWTLVIDDREVPDHGGSSGWGHSLQADMERCDPAPRSNSERHCRSASISLKHATIRSTGRLLHSEAMLPW